MNKEIKLSDIKVNNRKRTASDKKYIQTLSKSIDTIGLIQDITISKDDTLISGYHRLKALELLGRDTISVKVLDLNALQAELVEIDENIIRKNLNTIEFYEQLQRKRKIYEELYPESKKSNIVKLNLKKKKSDIKTGTEESLHFTNNSTDLTEEEQQEVIDSMPKTFTKDYADVTGTSERSVQMKSKLAAELEGIDDELKQNLKQISRLNDSTLKEIVKLDKNAQNSLREKIEILKQEGKEPLSKDLKQFIHEVENERKIQRLKPQTPHKAFKLTLNKCYLGKCENVLNHIEDNFFTSCITDVPYGLSYNGNIWDLDMPSQKAFDEIYRTLKEGAFFVTTFSSRSDLVFELLKRVEKSGFDMTHSNLNWIYSSGMGRSAKIKDKIDRNQIEINSNLFEDERDPHLKPSFEPIFVFQKPILKSRNFNKDGKSTGTSSNRVNHTLNSVAYGDTAKGTISDTFIDSEGNKKMSANLISFNSGNERIDKFFNIKNWTEKLNIAGDFFDIAKPSPIERLKDKHGNIIKFEDDKKKHDTVKPVALYLYLLKMFDTNSIPTILEPFAGSGSTLLSAELLDYNYVGVEMEPDHYEIIKKRLLQEGNFIA